MTVLVKKEILNCTSASQQKELDLLLLTRHLEETDIRGSYRPTIASDKTKNINDEEGA